MAYDYKILIGGKLVKPAKNETMEVINPANNTVAAIVPKCSEIDVNLAVEAANKARSAWKATYIGDRSELLVKLAAIIREHQDELVLLETMQYGGPISKTTSSTFPSRPRSWNLWPDSAEA
jgi:acyl-CoA reductase-like NAD-dependent aldehyde dehydrogenase